MARKHVNPSNLIGKISGEFTVISWKSKMYVDRLGYSYTLECKNGHIKEVNYRRLLKSKLKCRDCAITLDLELRKIKRKRKRKQEELIQNSNKNQDDDYLDKERYIRLPDGSVTPHPTWQKKLQQNRFKYYLKKSNIPEDYYLLDFDSFAWKHSKGSVEDCKYWAENLTKTEVKKLTNMNLYLYGTNTTGKTTIQCAIGKTAIKLGLKVRFMLAGDLIGHLMKTGSFTKDVEAQKAIADITSADVILIDDVFDPNKSILWNTENKTLIIAKWDTFFRNLLSQKKKVVLTSNMQISEVQSSYGKSLFELLQRWFMPISLSDSVKNIRRKDLIEGTMRDQSKQ